MAVRLSVTQSTIVNLETKFRGRIPTLFAYLRVLGVHYPILADARPRRLIPPTNPDEADRVFTPRALAVAIVDSFRLELSGTLLDPARGQGAFYDAFPAHLARDWCEIDAGRDFFAWSQPVDWIITNPPFVRFRVFLIHGMAVASNVLFLAPLTHFTTRHRVSAIREAGFAVRRILLVPTPIDWPSSGFQMAAVHLQRGWAGSTKIGALPG